MFGWSVPQLSAFYRKRLPLSLPVARKSYFFMFPQIGAAIILLSIQSGGRRAIRFVGTITLPISLRHSSISAFQA